MSSTPPPSRDDDDDANLPPRYGTPEDAGFPGPSGGWGGDGRTQDARDDGGATDGAPPGYGDGSGYGTPPPPPPPPPASAPGYGPGGYGPGAAPGPYRTPGAPFGSAPAGYPPPNHLVWAILTTVLCCLPAGVVSIVFAAQVNSKWYAGDVHGARRSSDNARTWAIVSAVVAAIFLVIALAAGALD
ncbi:CD225/dispanin family protein [Litorihabitans aurantiacus]|uniref:Interferon-induced transmembrane protein n=1 Tax=Litorihabitans aurantiacus TaxID=1930061 RepID=A0AA37XDE6_9MICO|nr:CD225/dispanin family protein [Litorihabitans aurantiacus]GMA31125.1 hypothetical protein GCM10025875_11170 [Litorihabitans aurantiacus]